MRATWQLMVNKNLQSTGQTRRHFFGKSAHGLGIAALTSLLVDGLPADASTI